MSTNPRNFKRIRNVLIVTMLLNFIATAIKLAAGFATGALSVIADGFDSLFDGLSNIVGLAGLYASERPPDQDHPYGHRKFETLAALSIAVLLFLTAFQLLQTSWEHYKSQSAPMINQWTVIAMLTGMLLQAGTSFYELKQGKKLKSEVLVADALHTRASILISFSVLGGLALIQLGISSADAILAAFVSLMIIKIGIDILKETIPALVDTAAIDAGKIAGIVSSVSGVESFHRVRSRGAAGSTSIDLHIRVSPNKTLIEANAIADEVRRRLLELDDVIDVIIHFEAQRMDSDAADIAAGLRIIASELGLTIHEMEISEIGGSLTIDVHIGVNPILKLKDAHELMDLFEQQGRIRFPDIHWIHTHIELATTEIQRSNRASSETESYVESIALEAIKFFPMLSNPHEIRVRYARGIEEDIPIDQSDDKLLVSLHCFTLPELPVDTAHRLATQLEREISNRLKFPAEISVHLEPKEQ